MKRLKKIFALMICVNMMFMICGIESLAASGELRFSDPSTTVGANVDVTARLSADEGVGSVTATLSYDSQSLRFVGGNGAVDTGGQIQLTGDGGGSSEVNWTIQFQALAEGSTQITIASVSASASGGGDISVTQGSSTVTIGPGDPSLITQTDQPTSGGGGNIEIDGQSYTVSTEIPDVLIPEGFVRADLTYGGQVYAATRQEIGSIYAVYLANPEGEQDFYLYDPETEAFSMFEQVSVSDTRYIVLLSEDKSSDLPDYLQRTTMAVNGKEFPAWQNIDASSYYVVYALNSDGEKGYYQYDTIDGTYQRYTPEPAGKSDQDDDKKAGILNKLRNNLDKVILVVWGIFLVMLLVIIILAIKLRHRNLELDDLYDEYGIDLEDEEEDEEDVFLDKKSKKKAEKEAKKNKKKKSEDDFDNFDDEIDLYDEEEYDEEEYEDDDIDEDEFQEYDASDYEDDSDIEDLDAMLNARVRVKKPAKRPKTAPAGSKKQIGHAEDDDTFKMDLIDLD